MLIIILAEVCQATTPPAAVMAELTEHRDIISHHCVVSCVFNKSIISLPFLSTSHPTCPPSQYVPRAGACGRGAWRLTSLPLLQERLVAPPFLPELKRAGGRRGFDYEAAAKVLAGKSAAAVAAACNIPATSSGDKVPVVAPPSHRTGAMLINGWQEAAIDLTKSAGEVGGGGGAAEAAGSSHKLPPPISAPLSGSVGIDMAGILQAGLIHPVTGQIVNGNLRGDDSLRRRRGRRRNVEALYSEFTKSRGLHLPDTQVGGCMS